MVSGSNKTYFQQSAASRLAQHKHSSCPIVHTPHTNVVPPEGSKTSFVVSSTFGPSTFCSSTSGPSTFTINGNSGGSWYLLRDHSNAPNVGMKRLKRRNRNRGPLGSTSLVRARGSPYSKCTLRGMLAIRWKRFLCLESYGSGESKLIVIYLFGYLQINDYRPL